MGKGRDSLHRVSIVYARKLDTRSISLYEDSIAGSLIRSLGNGRRME